MPTSTDSARVPDFFIVGHHKSGTTALYRMLGSHPQIYMPDLKEPKFFASDLPARLEPPAARTLPGTLAEYLALFADAAPEQRAGEASPSYLRSHTAAGLIASLQPAARIIAILREPASFVRSMHLQLVQSHVETEKDLAKALAAEDVERAGQAMRRYSDHVSYAEQLRRYHEVFPPEQVLVLIYDDFRTDNEGTLRTVLRFLEVDDTVKVELVEANPTVAVRSLRLDSTVRALYEGRGPLARAARTAVRTATPERLRREVFPAIRRRFVYGTPPPPDESVMAQLRHRFKAEVVAVSEYLDRDLVTLWGYDSFD
jgi:Sulfotransferase family